VLDEPTTGLHFEDIRKLLGVLGRLVDQGNSVIVIEHNLDVIKTADWVIDMGPEGGSGGGSVVAQGTPEQVAAVEASHTGRFLREVLAGRSAGTARPRRRAGPDRARGPAPPRPRRRGRRPASPPPRRARSPLVAPCGPGPRPADARPARPSAWRRLVAEQPGQQGVDGLLAALLAERHDLCVRSRKSRTRARGADTHASRPGRTSSNQIRSCCSSGRIRTSPSPVGSSSP
jgi:ABC-type glutathione transport system ATPase component